MDFEQKISEPDTIGVSDSILGILPSDSLQTVINKISKKIDSLENYIKENTVIEDIIDIPHFTEDYFLSVKSEKDLIYFSFDLSKFSTPSKIDTTLKVYSTNKYGVLYSIYESGKKDKGAISISPDVLPIKVIIDHRAVVNGQTLHFSDTKELNLNSSLTDNLKIAYPVKIETLKDVYQSLSKKVDYLLTRNRYI